MSTRAAKRRHRRTVSSNPGPAVWAFPVLIVLVVCVGGGIAKYAGATYHKHWATCAVTGKDRGYDSRSGSSNYRVYTADCDTLTVQDSWINGQHNASNLYGMIEPGKRYRFEMVGFRMGIGSHFPNIIAVQPLQATDR